jgi:hypothetical protein
MKRYCSLFIQVAVLIIGLSGTSLAQTVDEVIEKHLTALGGREALAKLQSRKMVGTITVSAPGGDIVGSIESYAKSPNKSRSYIKLDLSAFGSGEVVVDQRFNGATGYMIHTVEGNREITGNQLENLRNGTFPNPLLTYKEAGIKIELLPKEKVGEKDAIVLLIAPRTGSAVREFLDAETNLPIKMTMKLDIPQMGEIEQTTEFSDFREVDGVKIPFQLKVTNPAQTLIIKAAKIEHNSMIEDSIFERPVAQ